MNAGVNLLGAGRFARDVARALADRGTPARAFLTSGEPAVPTLDGLPCRKLAPQDLAEAELWVAVFNHQRASDYGALASWLRAQHPDARVRWPQDWFGELADALGFRFWLQPRARYDGLEATLQQARARFDDQASRVAFDHILAFRCEADQASLPPEPSAEPQYLPQWLQQHLRERNASPMRLVDGGAYQGETIREFAGLWPLAQAWAFEPDHANHAALLAQTADLPIQAFRAGLSDQAATLGFEAGSGAASRIDNDGRQRIEVLPLDDALQGQDIDFLKLDVEGHELQALAGARQTLLRCRPVLAVAAYHRWDDLWQLPAFIDHLGLGYRLRLMVHQHNSFDTVLYAF